MSKDEKHNKSNNQFKTFELLNGQPVEECWNPETGEFYFVKFDSNSGKIERLAYIEGKDGKKIYPLKSELIPKGNVILASYPEEYGNFGLLFNRIKEFIHKFVELPEPFENISTYYVIFTWVYDCFNTVPYLRVMGEPKKGKSRFLEVMASLCYKSILGVAASSTAALYRVIEMFKGTLLMDEGDFTDSDEKAKLTKILNVGNKSKPALLTCEQIGKNWEPKGFEVFGPKVIATRRPYKDTALESRCLTQTMTGRTRNDIPLHIGEDFHKEAAKIRDQLLMFRLKNYGQFKIDPNSAIAGLDDRLNQIAMPLLAIVEAQNDKEQIIQHLKALQEDEISDKALSIEAMMITALFKLWQENKGNLPVKDIANTAAFLCSENNPDPDFKLTPRKAGNILRTLGYRKERKDVGYVVVDNEANRNLLSRHCREFGMEPLNNELPELTLSDIDNLNVMDTNTNT